MPTAEYYFEGNFTLEEVSSKATIAAGSVWSDHATFVTQSRGILVTGLRPVKPVVPSYR